MSAPQEKHQDQTATALAALTACIVQTLGESNPSFPPAFLKNLDDLYYRVRENHLFEVPALETLQLVRDLLKK
ncbi:MAG: hypothetical protein HY847_10990 [Betaproteobacteria bacterium]|nr:hypothetical protein [Betaproteobacteria bacterium]